MRHLVSVLRFGAIGLFGLGAGSCVDNSSSLFIQSVIKPQAPTCKLQASSTSTFLGRGILDVAFRYDYQAGLLVGNQLLNRGNNSTIRAETNRLPLHGAEVRLSDAQGDIPNGYFTVTAAGFADVTSNSSPGYGVISVTLIPEIVGSDIADELMAQGVGASKEVTARVRVFGETLGGISIDSSEFIFPIDVCYGCLIYFPLDAVQPDANGVSRCLFNPEGAMNPACVQGQDDLIDCRNCVADNALCLSP